MRLIPIQEAFRRRFDRQAGIPGLEFHASGHCVHVGRVSPGCYACFAPDALRLNLPLGSNCNCRCDYCYRHPGEPLLSSSHAKRLKAKLDIVNAIDAADHYRRAIFSFTSGGGDPLLHEDLLAEGMQFLRRVEGRMKVRPWYYLYTNGILADRDRLLRLGDMGFHEIRFHLGASGFSDGVYRNAAQAVEIFETVTVETPAWPPHRSRLFEMLPRLDAIGVKHLNVGQIEITPGNRDRIAEVLPDAEVFQCHAIHLDDGGLVYDLMEEVLRRRYRFSVLDCSALVKSLQRSPGMHVLHESVEDLCADVPAVAGGPAAGVVR
jgi:pyruvate formate-lyase activating enzyme-like uncharacterized protein